MKDEQKAVAKRQEPEIRHLPGGGVEVKVKVDLREPHDRPELLAERLGISIAEAREMLRDYPMNRQPRYLP